MTHTRNRKLRERSTIRVKRLHPELIEGRMAKGHRSLDGPEPWRPKMHGWRDIGSFTRDIAPWSESRATPLVDIEAAISQLTEHTGYSPHAAAVEQRQFLDRYLSLPPGTPLFFAPHRHTNG